MHRLTRAELARSREESGADACGATWLDAHGTVHTCLRSNPAHVHPHRCRCGSERALDSPEVMPRDD